MYLRHPDTVVPTPGPYPRGPTTVGPRSCYSTRRGQRRPGGRRRRKTTKRDRPYSGKRRPVRRDDGLLTQRRPRRPRGGKRLKPVYPYRLRVLDRLRFVVHGVYGVQERDDGPEERRRQRSTGRSREETRLWRPDPWFLWVSLKVVEEGTNTDGPESMEVGTDLDTPHFLDRFHYTVPLPTSRCPEGMVFHSLTSGSPESCRHPCTIPSAIPYLCTGLLLVIHPPGIKTPVIPLIAGIRTKVGRRIFLETTDFLFSCGLWFLR